MAETGFSFESDMADFIRENLRDNQRVRSKGAPEFSAPPTVTQTTSFYNETRPELPKPPEVSGSVFGGGGAEDSPLTVIRGSAANKVQIVPGYINGVMVKLGGVALDNATPPELTISGLTTIYLKVVTTYAASPRDVATVQTTTGNAQLTPDGFTSYRRIAEVTLENGSAVIANFSAGGSYGVAAFGATIIWWKE
jgi:hypothetical protein